MLSVKVWREYTFCVVYTTKVKVYYWNCQNHLLGILKGWFKAQMIVFQSALELIMFLDLVGCVFLKSLILLIFFPPGFCSFIFVINLKILARKMGKWVGCLPKPSTWVLSLKPTWSKEGNEPHMCVRLYTQHSVIKPSRGHFQKCGCREQLRPSCLVAASTFTCWAVLLAHDTFSMDFDVSYMCLKNTWWDWWFLSWVPSPGLNMQFSHWSVVSSSAFCHSPIHVQDCLGLSIFSVALLESLLIIHTL